MLRLIVFLAAVAAAATGLAWLADRPGNLVINWEGYEIETSVFRAVVLLAALVGTALFVWSLLRQIWSSPAAVGRLMTRRRQKRGLEALSSGMIAIGAGDRSSATRYAIQARKALPNEPLTHLLRAQAAQLSGDATTSRRIFEAMLATPDTEQLGLRGLFLEAQREGEREAARQFAERAIKLNPKLGWAVDALFELQCKDQDWSGALETVGIARKHGHIEKASADRRRAVLLAARAIEKEDSEPEKALSLALESHGLAPDLVPAAALAGRMLASRGNTPRATKIIQKAWQRSPHPDLAMAYAYARLGDSPRDRYDRVRQLAMLNPMSVESAIASAMTAVEAKLFDEARAALEPFIEGRLTQRICLLMARIEGEQHGDKGRVREWLARAVNAPRDPAWTADGVVADRWAPVSPVTGALDAFQWRVPPESAEKGDSALIQKKLEELVPLGAARDPALTAKPVDATAAGTAAREPAGRPAVAAETPMRARDATDADVVTGRSATTVSAAASAADAPASTAAPKTTVAVEPAAAPAAPSPEPTSATAAVVPNKSEEPATQLTAAAASVVPAPAVAASSGAGKGSAKGSSETATTAKTLPHATVQSAPQTKPLATMPAAPPQVAATAGAATSAPSATEANANASAAYARLSEQKPRARTTAAEPAAAARVAPSQRLSTEPRTADARIFVPPRAPDDPGPEGSDVEEVRPAIRAYQRITS